VAPENAALSGEHKPPLLIPIDRRGHYRAIVSMHGSFKTGIMPQKLGLVLHFKLASCRVMPKYRSNHETLESVFLNVCNIDQSIRDHPS
jgi:hypothetical protein